MPDGIETNANPPVGIPQNGAPFSPSPAVGPTPNMGMEAQAAQEAAIVQDMLVQIIGKLSSSETKGIVADLIAKLGKIAPAGSVSPAAKNNQLESAMRNNQQNGQMIAMLKARGGMGAGAPGGAAPPAAPQV